ncbi:hypothetical protein GAR05_04817 [Micromonospora saelicesensis]|uniref:Uncharacterized protein n=2 Tax=Micromonospora saelicesensis TaxID=285676 RepID=A0ABX9CDM6_9ACTN|nr:hypothetical protein GAR05_04817 [Micromonospora saelicesensis]RAO63627.1 hypothetical protein PSN01_00349 [Micromonospora saelicesensis]
MELEAAIDTHRLGQELLCHSVSASRHRSWQSLAGMGALAFGPMEPVDMVLAVVCAAANLAMAAVLLVRSRGGTAVPRIFGRRQPLPRLRAAMHACLGLGLGVGLLVKDIFPPDSTGDAVVFHVVRILLVAAGVTALLSALRYPRSLPGETARQGR